MFTRVIWTAALFGWIVWSPGIWAQSGGSSVRIYTDPAGAYFQVDGQPYSSAVDLFWVPGGKHVVTSYDQNPDVAGSSLVFKGWVTNLNPAGSPSLSEPLTADPNLTWIKLVFEVSYSLTINLINCPGDPCATTGRVEIVGTGVFDRFTQLYVKAGTKVEARALPNSGYVFNGWAAVYGVPTALTQFDITFTMVGPTQLAPSFTPANPVQGQVNIVTVPPQLQVLLDRTPYLAPVSLEWGWGTTHAVGVNPVQVGQGVTYVFSSWSDGGALNHDYVVPSQSGAINLMATFVPAALVSFQSSPPGLALSIDGTTKWASYDFAWVPGSAHAISAPATQIDSQGHQYRFASWSNGQTMSFSYKAPPAPGNDRVLAVYQPVGKVTIATVPAGLTIQVDGAACTSPCTVQKDSGATVSVAVPPRSAQGDQSRLVFQGWDDSPNLTRVIAVTGDSRTYTASYNIQNRLSLTATPSEGASLVISPNSPDGFYDAGSLVSVTVKLALGFQIMGWSGDMFGSAAVTALTLDSPKSGALLLARVPAIAPLGIQNAAAGAGADSFAPGSLITIYGANLGPDLLVGPSNPLAQTLENVTVRVDGVFLPLVFVSPGQINAQLPSGLAEGNHSIIVRWEGKPETSAPISIARNAPGLFNNGSQSQPVGSFVHANGSAVTADQPAQAAEIVTLLGTGFGPYAPQPPDGYVVDQSGAYTLLDSITVIAGDGTTIDPVGVGKSGLAAGLDRVTFQVPSNLPSAPLLPVKIRVNGKESNSVLLPISN